MKNRFKKLTQGFTIIEVMIVLAIAGIIMAIIFLAIPQLQRNARDNGREAAVNRIKAELETYASANTGSYPWSTSQATVWWGNASTGFYGTYINGKVSDSANGQPIWAGGDGTAPANFIFKCASTAQGSACGQAGKTGSAGNMIIIPGGKCAGSNGSAASSGDAYASQANTTPSNTTSVYAMVMQLDRSSAFYCVDNG